MERYKAGAAALAGQRWGCVVTEETPQSAIWGLLQHSTKTHLRQTRPAEGLSISVVCPGLSHPFVWLESCPHMPDLFCGADIPETLPHRILTCSHPSPGRAQDVPQLCISSPRKALPQEPPTSRTKIWALAASPRAPGVQGASRAPALSRRHQSLSQAHSFQGAQRALSLARGSNRRKNQI